jgi:aspartate/methionine/tyrosine aminotransferase
MFSRRTTWNRAPSELAGALEGRRAAGREILDLTVSDPARAGLAWDGAELAAILARPAIARHEPAPFGALAAREAIAGWWRERGVPARPERLVLAASTSESYSWLFKLLCDPGDDVLVPQPSYPLFEFLTELESVRAVPYRLRAEATRWRLDVESLADRLTDRTRAVLVVHPNNPTGSRLDAAEARALAAACAERGIALVSDEVFAEFTWRPHEAEGPHGLLAVGAEAGALTFALSGLSKVAGLPQLKLAWCAVDGPPDRVAEALGRLECVADTYLSVAAPAQLAAAELLERSAAFRRRALERVREGLARLQEAAGDGLRRLPGQAGWSAVLEVETDAERLAVELLDRDGVLLHPGGLFGLPPGHLVVSLLTPTDALAEGLRRLRRALDRG